MIIGLLWVFGSLLALLWVVIPGICFGLDIFTEKRLKKREDFFGSVQARRELAYETLIPPLDPETRLEWLARNDYEPQLYDQLAQSYQRLGYDESARKVRLAQERRARDSLPLLSKAWGYLQDVTIGYGYCPTRALMLFILVTLVGVVFFSIFSPYPLADKNPQFNPFFYALDVLVPFADFGQRDLWTWTTFHEVFRVIFSVFGWVLAITGIAGLNRKLTQADRRRSGRELRSEQARLAWSERLRPAHFLLTIAVQLLPPSERARYLEEFRAELLDIHRDTRLSHALSLLRGVFVLRLRRGLRNKAADAAARKAKE